MRYINDFYQYEKTKHPELICKKGRIPREITLIHQDFTDKNTQRCLACLEAIPILSWRNTYSGNLLHLFLTTRTLGRSEEATTCCGRIPLPTLRDSLMPVGMNRDDGQGKIYSRVTKKPIDIETYVKNHDMNCVCLSMGGENIYYYWHKNVKVDIHCVGHPVLFDGVFGENMNIEDLTYA